MVNTFRIGTNTYDYCNCGKRKIAKARTCRYCMRQANARPVVVAGARYESLGAAARTLNMLAPTLRYRIKSNSFPDYYYVNGEKSNE